MAEFDKNEYGDKRVAVVIPAKNEGLTVAKAVHAALQYAHDVVVMDGHSTDDTVAVSEASGGPADNGTLLCGSRFEHSPR